MMLYISIFLKASISRIYNGMNYLQMPLRFYIHLRQQNA